MTEPLIDKTFEGMISQMRRDITELKRRMGRTQSAVPILPSTWSGYGPDAGTVTAAAAIWQDIDASLLSFTITPTQDLEVTVDFSASVRGSATVYGMLGIATTGGVVVPPVLDQASATNQFALTPFSFSTVFVNISGTKTLVLPGGVATTIRMQKRRSADTFAPDVNYPTMRVRAERWV